MTYRDDCIRMILRAGRPEGLPARIFTGDAVEESEYACESYSQSWAGRCGYYKGGREIHLALMLIEFGRLAARIAVEKAQELVEGVDEECHDIAEHL